MEQEIKAPTDRDMLRTFEIYHENSKQRRFDVEFSRRIHLVNNNPEFHKVISRAFKSYPGAFFVPLPPLTESDGSPFEHVAAMRRSIRRFDGTPLSLAQLGRLLHFTAGITGRLDASDHDVVQPVRAAPSGGALYPIELYAAVLAVEGLNPGLYHYAPDRRGLEHLSSGSLTEHLSNATSDPAMIAHAAVVFVLTGAFGRSHFKYGERGYRFALLEAGHICQNLLLEATSLKLGAVAVGGFIDDEVNAMLDVDGVDEAVIYLVSVGVPAPRRAVSGEALVDKLLGAFLGRGVSPKRD